MVEIGFGERSLYVSRPGVEAIRHVKEGVAEGRTIFPVEGPESRIHATVLGRDAFMPQEDALAGRADQLLGKTDIRARGEPRIDVQRAHASPQPSVSKRDRPKLKDVIETRPNRRLQLPGQPPDAIFFPATEGDRVHREIRRFVHRARETLSTETCQETPPDPSRDRRAVRPRDSVGPHDQFQVRAVSEPAAEGARQRRLVAQEDRAKARRVPDGHGVLRRSSSRVFCSAASSSAISV